MMILIVALIFLSAGLFAWGMQGVSTPNRATKAMQDRVYSELGTEEERRQRWTRVLQPVVQMNRALGLERNKSQLENYLIAGKLAMSQSEFLVIREMTAVTSMLIYLFVMGGLQRFDLLIFSVMLASGFFLPFLWLKQRIARRRRSISRDLPEVVELLALCVEAGADFMNAMQRVVREYRRCPLRDELALLLQEVRVGKRRREAFRSLANRVQVPEVTSLSRTIIHADRMGTGMVQALRIMSEDCRLQRYHQAERFAQQAPLKMLIPMVFIMFSVLLVVAGPVMLQFLRGELFPKF